MTKKDLQKAIRWLKKDTEIIYKDEKNVVHGIEKICYSVDSDGHTFLILEANLPALAPLEFLIKAVAP